MRWLLVPVGVGHLAYHGHLAYAVLFAPRDSSEPGYFFTALGVLFVTMPLYEAVALPHIALVPAAISAGIILLGSNGPARYRVAGAVVLTAGGGLTVLLVLLGSAALALIAMWVSVAAAVLTGLLVVVIRRRRPQVTL